MAFAGVAASAGMVVTTVAVAAPSASHRTKIGLRHAPKGRVLDGSSRKYVYVHVTGKKDVGCNIVCQYAWPLVTSAGKPRAVKGVKQSKLGVTAGHQVTYYGHPLFYYSPSPQDPSIDGANSFGGAWRLVNRKGKFK